MNLRLSQQAIIVTSVPFVFEIVLLILIAGNTRRLAANQALMPALDGGDEFADIDRAFRAMAHDLEQAHLKRTELLQMVAHDLRSPLSSILISLASLQQKPREKPMRFLAKAKNAKK